MRDCEIAVPLLPFISNFDDLDPLRLEPGVRVEMIPRGRPLPASAHAILLPGSKATIADLEAFRAEGWDIDLAAHIRRGGRVLGLCGGFQMLGREVSDPDGIEGPPHTAVGLGHLDFATALTGEKTLRRVGGTASAPASRATRCTLASAKVRRSPCPSCTSPMASLKAR